MAEPLNPKQIVNSAEDAGIKTYSDNLQEIPRLSGQSNIFVTEVITNNIQRNTVNNFFLPDDVTANSFPALATAPVAANVGSVYYDTGIQQLLVWNGSVWAELANNVTAANVSFVPSGVLVGTNVQDVMEEMVPIAGGTMTGYLTLSAGPITNLHAATKQYVDTAINFDAQMAIYTNTGSGLTSTTIGTAITELAQKTSITGSNTQVLFFDGAPALPIGVSGFTYDKTSSTLSVGAATFNATANAVVINGAPSTAPVTHYGATNKLIIDCGIF